MKAVDTNVLVRFFVEDDAAQSRKARRLVEDAGREETPLYVSDVVLCELVWVLEARYKLPRRRVGEVLDRLLHASQVRFTAQDVLDRAVNRFLKGRGNFADYVIAEHANAAGCESVATFDKVLLGGGGFTEP